MGSISGDMTASATSEPVVDVGIPAWGPPTYLEWAIESVLAQSFGSWRLHISHDGRGGDETKALMKRYLSDPRVSYAEAYEPLGAAGNKTSLIRRGEGKYVALLDHDDFWGRDFLASRLRMLKRHPEAAFAFSPSVTVDREGQILHPDRPLLREGCHPSEEILPLVLRISGIPGGTILARRTAYEAVGAAFDESFPRTYDYEMWIRLALRFPVCYVTAWDAFWRRHPQQASADLRQLEEEYRRLLDHLDGLVAAKRSGYELSPRERRVKLAGWLLSASLDAVEQGNRATSAAFLGRALRIAPTRVADFRTAGAALGLLLGRRGGRLVVRMRRHVHRRRFRPQPLAP
jgi:glycosyltransferase involved in cell wall biosynthesis